MKIKEVLDALEHFAPLPLQEDYDNAGLQVGLTEAEVSGALLCLDVTEAVVDEAIATSCNVIVSHHPLIFRKLRRISGEDYVQRAVMKAIKYDIAIISMHTNLDSVYGGVNFKIAEKIGGKVSGFLHHGAPVEPIKEPVSTGYNKLLSGEGAVCTLDTPIAADDFIKMLKSRFAVECMMTNQLLRRPIRTVAICGGAGDFLLGDAMEAGTDAFITGEMHYHQYFGCDQQIQIAVLGHYQSEQFTKEIFRDIIHRECPGVNCVMSGINTNPILYL